MDASAITAFLRVEAGNDIVEERLLDPASTCIMHAVNLCEVYYDALAPVARPQVRKPFAIPKPPESPFGET